ncbi:thiamine pyrophosphate-dependent dehydrogenase E1 component subunit alpha [Micromonospora sp. NPDC047548]|uniref:thiamine pyrophosphate-dependent dehydrogenase E1 component subunit alpha n=1 Tax=Micromonospora sp. NPDC047548 TaxID=3155624 RepID=UPI0033FC7D95
MTATRTEAPPTGPTRLTDADLDLLLLIRHFELALLDMFGRGELHGTTHTCLGQEYVPVALRPLLDDGDHVFSNHRGHGHYLARFADPHGLLAEVMGRQGAVCHGVGGSQHILRDRYLSTGVQGESAPVAAGVALHLKRAEPGRLALVYVGDGTWGEGAVYEALNMAALWELPLVLVVENNGIAQSTPTGVQLAGSIGGRARAFGVDHLLVTSTDTNTVRAELAPVLRRVRDRSAPQMVELLTHRVGPHSKGDDSRRPEEIGQARAHDWYGRYAAAFPEQFSEHDERQRRYVADVVREVSGRPASRWDGVDRG